MRTLFFLLLSVQLCFGAVMPSSRKIATPTPSVTSDEDCACSGAWASGNPERFEVSDGSFCTTTWTETDATAIVNTYNSAQSVTCGHSMSITEPTAPVEAYSYIATGDTAFSFRFYFRATGLGTTANRAAALVEVDNDTGFAGTPTFRIQLKKTAGAASLRISGTGVSTEVNVSFDTWYRVEVDCAGASGTVTMGVYSIGGAQVGSNVTATANAAATTYILFGIGFNDLVATEGNFTIYIDNVVISQASTFPIGPDE